MNEQEEFRRALLLEQFGHRVPEHRAPRPDVPVAQELDWLKHEQAGAVVHEIGGAA